MADSSEAHGSGVLPREIAPLANALTMRSPQKVVSASSCNQPSPSSTQPLLDFARSVWCYLHPMVRALSVSAEKVTGGLGY